MVVKLNVKTLKRLQRQHEGGDFLLAFDNRADPQESLALVTRAVEFANSQFFDDVSGNLMYGDTPIVAPRELVVYITECDSPEALDRWCAALVTSLDEAGWSGQVAPVRSEHCFYDDPDNYVDSYVAGLVVPIDLDGYYSDLTAGKGRTRWLVDSARTKALVDLATSFVLDGPGEIYFRHGLVQFRVTRETVHQVATMAISQAPPVALTRIGPDKGMARVLLGTLGHVHYELHLPGADWQEHVDVLTRQVDQHTNIIEYGFIRTGWSVSVGWHAIIDRRPPRPPHVRGNYSGTARELDASRVPDAFAIQWLTDKHLANASNLDRWEVEQISGRLHRVTAQPLAPWFTDPEPAQDVMDRARTDFGSLILTGEDLKTALRARH